MISRAEDECFWVTGGHAEVGEVTVSVQRAEKMSMFRIPELLLVVVECGLLPEFVEVFPGKMANGMGSLEVVERKGYLPIMGNAEGYVRSVKEGPGYMTAYRCSSVCKWSPPIHKATH